MQVLFLGRAPRTKETLPDFLKWRRVTRPPLVFRGLTGSQQTPGFWGVTVTTSNDSSPIFPNIGHSIGGKRRRKGKSFTLDYQSLAQAHRYVVFNCGDKHVEEYIQ